MRRTRHQMEPRLLMNAARCDQVRAGMPGSPGIVEAVMGELYLDWINLKGETLARVLPSNRNWVCPWRSRGVV
jgi:hypothetical protein